MNHLPQLCDGSVKLGFPKCRGLSFFSKFEKIDLYKVNLDIHKKSSSVPGYSCFP